jgi:pimeloyl-ACP methyl ester carboxylesterase
MMRTFWLAIVFAVGLIFAPAGAQAAPGHVYLLKGLANVFSTGLDNYAAELNRRHIPVTVANHSEAAGLAIEAARLYKAGKGPIVIVGHSLGGAASTQMAEIMQQQGAKVALIVNYGPPGNQVIPANVARVVNYYGVVGGIAVRGPGSRAAITNVNLSADPNINHFNMDKSPRLEAKTMAQILAALRSGHRAAPKVAVTPQHSASATPAQ